VTEKLDAYELGLAAQKIVDFIWDEFCDWYVEIVKPRLYNKEASASRSQALTVLQKVLITSVKLLHPFTPFITEDLFASLQMDEETVMLSAWPVYDPALSNPAAEKAMERVKETVRTIRNIRVEKQVVPSQKIEIIVQPNSAEAEALFKQGSAFIAFLAGASQVTVLAPGAEVSNEKTVTAVVDGAVLYLPLSALVDAEKERARLEKERQKLQQEIARVDGKLNNEGFMSKAPEKLVNEEKEKREKYKEMLSKVEDQIKGL
jgi:valyl-tRNA synthetase